ncbi:MAG TPA: FAD-dependent oxidoreductase [Actinomycetes bacterium]|nr:FAD-dependent oxidoreductase [Actinomycetes bacterium]
MARRVAVVGAGVTGLATAWFLQEQGVEVTVLERERVAAGASWGNTGWLMAADSSPLTHPETLHDGLRALLHQASPLAVPLRPDAGLYGFLLRFASHCTRRHWRDAMRAFAPLANGALSAYDALETGGVAAASKCAHRVAFTSTDERDAFAKRLDELRALGLTTDHDVLDATAIRAAAPVLSSAVVGGISLPGQRFVDPAPFMTSLAESVVDRGGVLRIGSSVRGVRSTHSGVEVLIDDARPRIMRFDDVVIATGAWLSPLVRRHGVRVRVRSGRGYSFRARLGVTVADPVYLPQAHVAASPIQGRLRFAGVMEFRRPSEPLDPRRIRDMVDAARPMLRGVDLDDREDEWVGPRPVSVDGMPLAGQTATPGVWCIGGHAMEGMVLGPVTARLLADAIATGEIPRELIPFDPCR